MFDNFTELMFLISNKRFNNQRSDNLTVKNITLLINHNIKFITKEILDFNDLIKSNRDQCDIPIKYKIFSQFKDYQPDFENHLKSHALEVYKYNIDADIIKKAILKFKQDFDCISVNNLILKFNDKDYKLLYGILILLIITYILPFIFIDNNLIKNNDEFIDNIISSSKKIYNIAYNKVKNNINKPNTDLNEISKNLSLYIKSNVYKLIKIALSSNLMLETTYQDINIKDYLCGFKFEEFKFNGIDPGIIVKKKTKNKLWLIKYDGPVYSIKEFIMTNLMNFLGWKFNLEIPKIKLIRSYQSDKILATGSKFIKDFTTVYNYYNIRLSTRLSTKEKTLHKIYSDFFMYIPNALKLFAHSVFLGNLDPHANNLGISLTPDSQRATASLVDFSNTLHFYNNKDNKIKKLGKITNASQAFNKKGKKFSIMNLLRSYHRVHYHINNSNFLNKDFIQYLRDCANMILNNKKELSLRIEEIVGYINGSIAIFPDEFIKKLNKLRNLKSIHPQCNIGNLEEMLFRALKTRARHCLRTCNNLEFQLAIENGDMQSIKDLLGKYPDIHNRRLKWLNSEINLENNNIDKFFSRMNSIDFINYKKELCPEWQDNKITEEIKNTLNQHAEKLINSKNTKTNQDICL